MTDETPSREIRPVDDVVEPPFPEILPAMPAGLPPGFAEYAYSLHARRPKFQHRYGVHLTFFLLTFLTTTFRGPIELLWIGRNPLLAVTWASFIDGLWYSLPLLTILGAHEFGHYFACRHHDVDATLPYFLPAPLPLTGTLGAVIKIREAFPSKRALFDIGVAGPIAGFLTLIPFLYWGMTLSVATVIPRGLAVTYFGEPLLWKAFQWLHFGPLPSNVDVVVHPLAFAAWWGMLATALNLLPFGQLDGGHIMYAALGRRATTVSMVTLVVVVLLMMQSASWFTVALMMLVMAMIFGFRHPRIIDEHEPLDPRRRAVAIFAVVMFALSFTPVPIDTFFHR